MKGEKLREACEKIPQLEELHLFNTNFCVSARSIEAIGRACPMLKSFTYNHLRVMNDRAIGNSIALAVAKTMPGLQYLQLFGNVMNNDGLKAILDGCPHLESLGLRDCFKIDLKGDLGKKCLGQVKYITYPKDTVAGYKWDTNNYEDLPYKYWYSEHRTFPDVYCIDDTVSDDDCYYAGPSYDTDYYDGSS